MESGKRSGIKEEERNIFWPFSDIYDQSLKAAEEAMSIREAREAIERRVKRETILNQALEGLHNITQEEKNKRHDLISGLLEIKIAIDEAAAVVARQIAKRDATVMELEYQRDRELRRLRQHHNNRIAVEEEMWQRHVGHEEWHRDLTFLTQELGLSSKECMEHLNTFFSARCPSAVISGSVGSVRSEYKPLWALGAGQRHGNNNNNNSINSNIPYYTGPTEGLGSVR
eukprot:Tbor_TRINITY_DN1111_c0_g1::TRINITY_DN1111_c0_g1_i1::g.15614::m.15614